MTTLLKYKQVGAITPDDALATRQLDHGRDTGGSPTQPAQSIRHVIGSKQTCTFSLPGRKKQHPREGPIEETGFQSKKRNTRLVQSPKRLVTYLAQDHFVTNNNQPPELHLKALLVQAASRRRELAPEKLQGQRTASELVTAYSVRPTMIRKWRKIFGMARWIFSSEAAGRTQRSKMIECGRRMRRPGKRLFVIPLLLRD